MVGNENQLFVGWIPENDICLTDSEAGIDASLISVVWSRAKALQGGQWACGAGNICKTSLCPAPK
ncbi:MAG TPA: hypothetical protein VF450_25045, partial [Noviherbaspirillum sp.]